MRKLLVVLVVLILGFVGADLAARIVTQRALAEQVALASGQTEEPEVTVHGFPFLAQMATGHYRHLTVKATDVPLDEDLTAQEVTAEIRDVSLSLSELSRSADVSVTAGSVDVSARLGYPALSAAATKQVGAGQFTFDLGYVDADTVHVSATTTILGQTVTGEADAAIRLEGQKLVFDFTNDLFGDVPSVISSRIVAISSISFPLDLPYGLTAEELTAATNGVTITTEGSQVTLQNP
jgi:hypothetical protein